MPSGKDVVEIPKSSTILGVHTKLWERWKKNREILTATSLFKKEVSNIESHANKNEVYKRWQDHKENA